MSLGTVAGRPVPVAVLNERLTTMYTSRAAATLPVEGSGEWRRLRRWVAQLLLTEELVRTEAAERGIVGDGTVSGSATTGSLSAAVLATLPLARALHDRITADVTVSDVDVRAYYDRNPDRWVTRERVRLRHVLSRDADPAGGELWERAVDDLPRPLAAVVRTAAPGDVVGPVESPFGWHTALVLDHTPGGRIPFERTRPAIAAELLAAARAEWFDRWLERRRRETVTSAHGYEHPGNPAQPDFAHHH